ncbi:MAG: hypothetical protein ACI9MC_004034 [Kiritimatiellia bacterium]|jgi:hypothetical protein
MRTLLPIVLLLSTHANAHPMGRSEFSLRNAVRMNKDGLHAVVMAEIPVSVVIGQLSKRAGGARADQTLVTAWNQEQWAALSATATLQVDGKDVPVSWTPTQGVINGRAVDGFFVYAIEAQLPAAQFEQIKDVKVRLKCDAWDDVPIVFVGKTQARGTWSVVASDEPTDWTRETSARALNVHFRRP